MDPEMIEVLSFDTFNYLTKNIVLIFNLSITYQS